VNWALGTYNNDVEDVGALANIQYRLPLSIDPTGQVEVRNLVTPTGATTTGLLARFRDKTNSQFLTFGVPFGDKWKAEVEARYSSEKRTQVAFSGLGAVLSKTYTDFTPRVNLSYEIIPGSRLYASVAKGVKAGGFNNAATADVVAFDPETNYTYELGAKQKLLGGTLQLNYNMFFIDWKNLQLSVPDTHPTPPNVQDPNYTGNVKGATSKGIELEAVMLFTDRLRGNIAWSYADSTFKSGVVDTAFGRLCETSTATPACVFLPRTAALPLGGSPIGGNALPRSPKTKIGVGLEYGMPVRSWKLTLRGDASYQAKYYVENLNVAYIPSRTLLNLDVALSDPDSNWSVSLWGKNVTDETYVSSSFAVSVVNQYIPALGDGRTFGLTANYRFNKK
jgi:iron complex outermembrane receptor protein